MPRPSRTGYGARSGCRRGGWRTFATWAISSLIDIGQDLVIIVRSGRRTLAAYHNVCPHRGRRLVDTPAGQRNARGTQEQFICGFHGWTFGLDGARHAISPIRKTGRAALRRPRRAGHGARWKLGRLDLDQPRSRLRAAGRLSRRRSRQCSIPIGCRTCAPAGASGLSSIATGRSRWRPSAKPTTSRPPTRNSTPSASFAAGRAITGCTANIGYEAPKGLEEDAGKLRIGTGDDRACPLPKCRTSPGKTPTPTPPMTLSKRRTGW